MNATCLRFVVVNPCSPKSERILALAMVVTLFLLRNTVCYGQDPTCPPGTHEVSRDTVNRVLRCDPDVVTAPSPLSPNWSGGWVTGEKKSVRDALAAVKDEELRKWIVANAEFRRLHEPVNPLIHNDALIADRMALKFNEDFFTDSKARQDNLMAFESGKVLWHAVKDRSVGQNQTFEAWFGSYALEHDSTIRQMKFAKHQQDSLSDLVDWTDYYSKFAYVFRAQALDLEKPQDEKTRQVWETVVRDVRMHLDPLLKTK